MERIQGFAEQGGKSVFTVGHQSSNVVQGSFPYATVTVFLTGTTTLATLYADNQTTPTPLANPFTANEAGWWFFYVANGRYDVRLSGGGLACPWTIGDVLAYDPGSGGGGGGDESMWTQNVQANGFSLLGAANVETHCVVLNGTGTGPMQICLNSSGDLQITDRTQTGRVWVTQAGQLRVRDNIYVKDVDTPDAGVQMWYDSAIAGGQGGTYAFDFGAQTYKRYLLDGAPLLLNSDLNSNANVGIHQSNPQYSLDITGNVNVTGEYFINGQPLTFIAGGGTPAAGSPGQVQFNAGGTPSAFGASGNLFWDNTKAQLRVYNNIYVKDAATPDAGVQMWYDSAIAGGQGGTYAFDFGAQVYKRYFLDGNPLLLNSDINSTSNVGIGTLTPNAALEIRRDVASGFGPTLLLSNTAGGAGAGAVIAFNSTGGGNNPDGQILAVDNGNWSVDLIFTSKVPGAYANPMAERVRITADGQLRVHNNVYVKDAATPDAGIQVWYDSAIGGGQGGTYAFDFTSQVYKRYFLDGAPLLLNSDLNSTGNVGIHQPNPQYALDVNGTANIVGQLRVTSILFPDSTTQTTAYTGGPGGSGVSSVNTLTGAVTLAAGSNVNLSPSGNTITIHSTGGGGGGAAPDFTAPGSINTSGVTLPTPPVGTTLQLGSSTLTSVVLDAYDLANTPNIRIRATGGTFASPAAVGNLRSLGIYYLDGFDGSSYAIGAQMQAQTTQAWTSTTRGTRLTFWTTRHGYANPQTALSVAGDGGVVCGTDVNGNGAGTLTAPNGVFIGGGNLEIGTGRILIGGDDLFTILGLAAGLEARVTELEKKVK